MAGAEKKEGLETPDVQNEVPGPQYFQQFYMDFLATGIAVDLVGLTSFRVLLFTHKVYHFRPTTKGPWLALEVLLSTSQSLY